MKNAVLFLLAGVAIGLLVAPDKGSKTWKKFVDKLDDLSDDAADNAERLYKTGKKKLKANL